MTSWQRSWPLPRPTPEEVRIALGRVRDFVTEKLAEPLAPDHEVRQWPLMTDPEEGGVWCADESCPLDCENSEIGEFRDGVEFTLDELHDAIAQHIAARREREEDLREDS